MKGRFPPWLHRNIPEGNALFETDKIINSHCLHTVCNEAKCPNRMECYSKKTATFLVMGKECTRSCSFCNVAYNATPSPLDNNEPERISSSVEELSLKHVVITMVTRDDLEDGGASHLKKIIKSIRRDSPNITIEVLTSDFNGNTQAYDLVLEEKPEIFNHNIETVHNLSSKIRHKASYDRSLSVLQYAKENSANILIKSGLMVGLGETPKQVQDTIDDLYEVGCDVITIGQYLQPGKKNVVVKEFIHPRQFREYEEYGLSVGVKYMHCGPFVRSSYNAATIKNKVKTNV